MPTNEDRKAVAAKLRRLEEENHWERARFIVGFIDALGLESRANVGECLIHLADLIEPEERKCRNKHPQQGGFWCSECDAALDGYIDVSGLVKQINYCPNCGAKVVD